MISEPLSTCSLPTSTHILQIEFSWAHLAFARVPSKELCTGSNSMNPTPNQALQRTRLRVTAPASTTAFPPTMQAPRRSGVSLSLGSLGDSHFDTNEKRV